MDTEQLEKALTNNSLTRDHFGGVYSSDEIPWQEKKKVKYGTRCFIFNLDRSDEPGSHWVCIILRKNAPNVYFDSYGMLPFFKRFEKFMNNCFIYNNIQLQHEFSTACGQWCLYIIYHILRNLPLQFIVERFNKKNKLKNDYICNHFVKRFYNIRPKVIARDFLKEQLEAEKTAQAQSQKGGVIKRKCQGCQPLCLNAKPVWIH